MPGRVPPPPEPLEYMGREHNEDSEEPLEELSYGISSVCLKFILAESMIP